MQITEPVTMLTDYALGAANLSFAVLTYTNFNSKNRVSGLLLLLGYLGEAISGFAGGTFHGFAMEFQKADLQWFWNITMVSAGATMAFLASAVHAADVRRENGKWIVVGVVTAVLGLAIQVTGFRSKQPVNHNDVFHVILIAAMYFFFRGARRLQDRAYSPR
jgi:hypothetical protein